MGIYKVKGYGELFLHPLGVGIGSLSCLPVIAFIYIAESDRIRRIPPKTGPAQAGPLHRERYEMKKLLLGLAVASLCAGIHATPARAAPGYDCQAYAKWGQSTVQECEKAIKGLPPANGNGGPCQNIAAITGHNQSECG
jgi:hypothetical protein